ncbi:hypothetical protein TrRE_jg13140 [Triparma retinervis]|uniref:Rho-GAP domain-containing protein n=1 Tax=Triparma retinervis TaxID=2557542 RepID=A0A9W7AFH1_9STRA|nr:hypothetical protein TrRE_jg13140 [Triparma retinervis]
MPPHQISCYLTPSGYKFLLLHPALGQDSVGGFFKDVAEVWVKLVLGGLWERESVVESKGFDDRLFPSLFFFLLATWEHGLFPLFAFFPFLAFLFMRQRNGRPSSRAGMVKVGKVKAEFTEYKNANVFTGTWNVNAKKMDPSTSLASWLFPPSTPSPPDIIAVGFQEIVDLNAVNVAVDSKASQRSLFWQDTILRTLSSNNRRYTLVQEVHLVGMLLCVYVQNKHLPHVSNVSCNTVGVGVMGVMGNKGGVSVRMTYYDSGICFVCSHFAAHRENVVGRNQDFHSIVSKTSFDVGPAVVKEGVASGSIGQWREGDEGKIGVMDHDVVWWLGDLNYRIDEGMGTEEVFEKAQRGDIETLRKHDQLNIERGNSNVFQGFSESILSFPPTYKYQPNTDLYECRPDKKLRAPAWCDRVLWHEADSGTVDCQVYERAELNISDHKPVMATFTCRIKNINTTKRADVYSEVMRSLDKRENQSLPKVDLDKVTIDFKSLYYDNKSMASITLTNTGTSNAHWRLVPKLEDEALCKEWVQVSPTFGLLVKGESCEINFSVQIDNETAMKLSNNDESLDDILILRLENGRDHYLTVSGKYARSCFGMGVRDLVLISEPVRDVPLDPKGRIDFEASHPPASLSVPKELWRIVDAISEKGLHEKDLFLTPGFAAEVKQIRECLDTNSDFGLFHIHSMAEVLVSFLASLSEPIVPSTLFPTLEIDQGNIMPWSRRFLEELPPIHYNCFVYIISFFREILLYSNSNNLSPAKLARVCTSCLIRSDEANRGGKGDRSRNMSLIFLHFLTTNSI